MDFDEYWKLLWTIKRDSNVEQYYDEILRPIFREVVEDMDNVKVIPTFDTRYRGKNRDKYRCITGDVDKLVWPDYVFVPINYTHDVPVSPYVKVEFKNPKISKKEDGMRYRSIYDPSLKFYNEIKSELSESPLILTDGITWLFLRESSDIEKIESEEGIEKLCFVDKERKYRFGYYVVLVQDVNEQFIRLKDMICNFIRGSELYRITTAKAITIEKS